MVTENVKAGLASPQQRHFAGRGEGIYGQAEGDRYAKKEGRLA